jgi:hypothetical protein
VVYSIQMDYSVILTCIKHTQYTMIIVYAMHNLQQNVMHSTCIYKELDKIENLIKFSKVENV